MFARLPKKTRRAPRHAAKQTLKAMKVGAKAMQSALRQSGKMLGQASKALGESRSRALTVAPAHRPPGRFVEVDGVRVHYIARGKGRPVVLIHGNGTMAEDFAISGLIDQLATRYRVIALDRPGFGHTERPRGRIWTASLQAQLVHRVLEAVNVERPVVVGHSWGTLVSLALAAGDWRDLRALVLLSGYYYPTMRADVALTAPLALPVFGDVARSMVPQAAGHLLAPHVFRQVFWPKPVPARFRARFPVEITMGASQQRASAEDTATLNAAAAALQPHYAALNVPLAILTGDMDAVVQPRDHSFRLHRDAPTSTLVTLKGHGHMIQYSALEEIGRAVDGLMGLPRTKT